MSKPVGSSVAGLIDAARGNTDVVKTAVDALRQLAKQPYKPTDHDVPAPSNPSNRTSTPPQP